MALFIPSLFSLSPLQTAGITIMFVKFNIIELYNHLFVSVDGKKICTLTSTVWGCP